MLNVRWVILLVMFMHGSAMAAVPIHLPETASAAEETAHDELAHYLAAAVKGRVTIAGKPAVFHLGDTPAARAMKIDVSSLADEAWMIQSDGENVVLAGGGARGTLYAVYHFLEDVLGVRWWTPVDETVPSYDDWDMQPLALSGRPHFRQRDIYRSWNSSIPDDGRFAARRRLNRDGDLTIAARYGGSVTYGPPYFVHTFHIYFPEELYFEKHPEYFALNDGKRVAGPHSQLCLTNPGMRREMFERLKHFIAEGESTAVEQGLPAPLLYDISINDARNPCECNDCQAIATREGSEAGPLLDCINEIAGQLKAYRPDLLLATLAYYHTEEPPRTLRPADNVVIRLCDTRTNQAAPFSAPENQAYVKRLQDWSRIADRLAIWDYSITFMLPTGPFPHEFTLGENLRTYAENNVQFMFFEHESPECADLYDLNLWLESKLMEDPYADEAALRQEFYAGFYGEAGDKIAAYRQLLNDSTEKHNTYIDWFASPGSFTMIDAATAIAGQQLFDDAVAAVSGDEVLVARVQRARLSLDRITTLNWRRIVGNHIQNGGTESSFPLDRTVLADRAHATWNAAIVDRIDPNKYERYRNEARREYDLVKSIVYVPLKPPAQFAGKKYLDFTVEDAKLYNGLRVEIAADTEAGVQVRVERAGELPLQSAMYVVGRATSAGGSVIRPDQIPGPGYHWYKMYEVTPESSAYIYILNDWTIQFPMDTLAISHPGQRFEVWFSVRFDGPSYPHGDRNAADSVSVERMVLVPIQ